MDKMILHIDHLSKSFGGLKLFDGVTLSLEQGTINTLCGSNGSGKTTFFNLIGGYEKADKGDIHFNGVAVNYHKEYKIVEAGIGRMWQDPAVFPNHTVLQNLMISDKYHPGDYFFNYFYQRLSIRNREKEIRDKAYRLLQKFRLSDKAEQLAGTLSLGEKKLLSISMLLINNARLLLLDEPFSGVNSDTIFRISEVLKDLKADGKTVFMIEHKITFAEYISDKMFKIDNQNIRPWDL